MSSVSRIHELPSLPSLPPHIRPTHLETGSERVLTQQPTSVYSCNDQLDKILDIIRSREVKIAVISNRLDSRFPDEDRGRVTGIATELNKMLSGSKALVYEYAIDNDQWLTYLRRVGVTYYIFVEFPPLQPYSTVKTVESEFFNSKSQRITEVVVIRRGGLDEVTTPGGSRVTTYTPVSYLRDFLHLDGNDKDIAIKSLCHFAASRPLPFTSDKAYWSEWPKVIQVRRDKTSLGLAIMTREMAPKSNFPRIILVKSISNDCMKAVREKVGKYTHIQSYNGILLDGLDISAVTSIIQATAHSPYLQLVVRYVHPTKSDTNTTGLLRNIPNVPTPMTPNHHRMPADRIDPEKETLPIPLMIFGDIHKHCLELFKHLSSPSSSPPFDIKSTGSSEMISSHPANVLRSNSTNSSTLLVPGQSNTTCKSEASFSSSHESREGSSDVTEHNPLLQSDRYVVRSSVSQMIFNTPFLSSPMTPIRTPHPPADSSQTPDYPHVEKQYILNMFTHSMDRMLSHLYLRESGLYLVVVSLEAMIDDPLIQYENLSFWLRLVQTYVKPSLIRRVMIVAMCDGTMNSSKEECECLEHLEGALQDEFHHIYIKKGGGSVILFDRTNPKSSVENLCSCINKCMDVVMNRTFFMNPAFFKIVFQPFTGLTDVLSGISSSSETTMSADCLLSLYKYTDPNYFDTLAAYSSSCISVVSDRVDSLLKPDFLIHLLKNLTLKCEMYQDSFDNHIPLLKKLPVVAKPWPLAMIRKLNNKLTTQQVDSIIKLAERYELIYSLGYHGNPQHGNHEVFFIPLLSTEFLGEGAVYDWLSGDEEEYWYNKTGYVTIIYAKLNFPALDQFFHSLLAELLKDVVNGSQHFPRHKCYINIGCIEGIMPVHLKENNSAISVYLKYHRLDNVIEFRAELDQRNKNYFHNTIQSKLSAAFDHSKYNLEKTCTQAISFHIPSNVYDPAFVRSALGVLCHLPQQSSGDGGSDYGGVDSCDGELLKMKAMTKEWASTNQDLKKNIPPESYIKWARRLSTGTDSWAIVGSRLNLLSLEEVEYYRSNSCNGGNGGLVLTRWKDSNTLTYKDLTETLRSSDVRLDTLADEIEGCFGTEV